MRVLIAGSSKTGSTALAYRLIAALPDHALYFEPSHLDAVPRSSTKVVTKFVRSIDPQLADEYDRCILLVRHPFDIIASQTFFFPNSRYEFLDDELSHNCLDVIQQIEKGHRQVGFGKIWETCRPKLSVHLSAISDGLRAVCYLYDAAARTFLLFRYEDMCSSRFEDLNGYLGIDLSAEGGQPAEHRHVARTKGVGDWKNWFNETDVSFFKSISGVAAYADAFGYDLTFDPQHQPDPNPKTGSQYFCNAIDLTRMLWGAPRFDPSRPADPIAGKSYVAAVASFDQKHYEIALGHAIAAVCEAPNRVAYFNLLAACCYRCEMIDAARAAAQAAIALDASLPFSWSLLAGCYAQSNDMQAALDAIERCGSLAPPWIKSRFGYARRLVDFCGAVGNWMLAEEPLRRMIAEDSHNSGYYTLLAEVLWRLSRNREALAAAERALATGDRSVHLHRLRASVLLAFGLTEEARASVDEALLADPKDQASLVLLREILGPNRSAAD
jgi:tetratricopeptide (TPR) repeat protein